MLYYKEEINNKKQINILPMIDIIFAILSFLIVSSIYLSQVNTIPVELPEAMSSGRQNDKFIIISIDGLGDLFLNEDRILLDDLRININNLIDKSSKTVVVNADKNVSHGVVIKVLDLLRSVDGLKIAISTKSLN